MVLCPYNASQGGPRFSFFKIYFVFCRRKVHRFGMKWRWVTYKQLWFLESYCSLTHQWSVLFHSHWQRCLLQAPGKCDFHCYGGRKNAFIGCPYFPVLLYNFTFMSICKTIPDNRIAVKKNINASFLVAVDLVAANGTSPVAQDNNTRTQAAVDSVTLHPRNMRIREKRESKIPR